MITKSRRLFAGGLAAIFLAAIMLASAAARAEDKDKLELDKIPKKVMEALETKFPKATILKWTPEKEGEETVYDFEFTQEGWKFEADILENGTLRRWEMAITAEDLPDAVRNTLEKRYAKAVWKEIMQITAVKEGKDVLEGFEIVLETADKKEIEVTVAPDGAIVEDAGDEE
jgi:hypothetical protein